MIRIPEGNFLASLSDLAQESRNSHRVPCPRSAYERYFETQYAEDGHGKIGDAWASNIIFGTVLQVATGTLALLCVSWGRKALVRSRALWHLKSRGLLAGYSGREGVGKISGSVAPRSRSSLPGVAAGLSELPELVRRQ